MKEELNEMMMPEENRTQNAGCWVTQVRHFYKQQDLLQGSWWLGEVSFKKLFPGTFVCLNFYGLVAQTILF